VFEPGTDGYYHYYRMVHAQDSGKVLEGLHLVFVELPKFKAENLTEKKMQVLWLRFLTEIDENAKSAPAELLENPQTCQALEILEESAYSEAEMLDYDRYWDQVRRDKALMDDLEDAHAKLDAATAKLDATTAERDAAVEKLRQTVRNFKAMNLDVEQIAKATGLTVEEVVSS
jgi:predicted transposase/invertase (TIGR01784 family)